MSEQSPSESVSDDEIPATAAPPPPKPPGAFSIGSPMFNMGLVGLLMAISFLAVALPSPTDDTATSADGDGSVATPAFGAPPGALAFEDPSLDVPDTIAEPEGAETDVAEPEGLVIEPALDDALVAELIEELRNDQQAPNPPQERLTPAAVTPAAPTPQGTVQVVYRTEQVRVDSTPTTPSSSATTNPPTTPTSTPATTTTDPPRRECTDFETRSAAQLAFDFDREGLAHFDGDGDGRACEQIVDPNATGPVTCDTFTEQPEAQAIFDTDPDGLAYLDGDGDGRACEQLPGAPVLNPLPAPAQAVLSVNAVRDQQGVFGLHTREAPWFMGEVDYISRLIGKAPNNLLFFSNWSTGFPAEQVRNVWGRGMTPQIAWEPVIPGADTQPTLREIADGSWDGYIDEWADAAAAHGQPIVLRLASEMNGNWYSWSEQTNGNNEGDFVDMWRHVHGRFEAAGADNVVWLWSVNRSNNLKTDIATYWPGEEYTDWVGISGYWRGFQGAPEPTFDAIFDQTLNELRALTAKPILLAEIGAGTNVDSDRVQWLNTVFAGLTVNPDVIGFVYFNDTKAGGDWRIQFSQQMVDAFANGVAGDRWQSGALPTGMRIGDRLSVPAHSDPNNQGLAEDNG